MTNLLRALGKRAVLHGHLLIADGLRFGGIFDLYLNVVNGHVRADIGVFVRIDLVRVLQHDPGFFKRVADSARDHADFFDVGAGADGQIHRAADDDFHILGNGGIGGGLQIIVLADDDVVVFQKLAHRLRCGLRVKCAPAVVDVYGNGFFCKRGGNNDKRKSHDQRAKDENEQIKPIRCKMQCRRAVAVTLGAGGTVFGALPGKKGYFFVQRFPKGHKRALAAALVFRNKFIICGCTFFGRVDNTIGQTGSFSCFAAAAFLLKKHKNLPF